MVGGGAPGRAGLQFVVVAEEDKSLDEMTVAELRERASELEITGRSSMNKDELVQSVKDAEEQTAMLKANSGSGGSSRADAEADSDASDSPEEKPWRESSSSGSDSGGGEQDASDTPAPSIGPNTTVNYRPPEERLDLDEISDVDAMGLDKRRTVRGKRYGASPAKQAAVYGGALAVIAALVFGAVVLVNEFDKPPPEGEVEPAEWATGDGAQKEPPRIDFPRSTSQDVAND